MNWEKKILKDYQNWFIKFRKNKKYWPKNCDIQFDRSISQIRKFIRKSEKEVYLKITQDKKIYFPNKYRISGCEKKKTICPRFCIWFY